MIISDLQYIETVENSEVQGGAYKFEEFSFADADAAATAVGDLAIALTETNAIAVPGGAKSSSSSTAISASGYKDKKDHGDKKHKPMKKKYHKKHH